MPEYTYDPNDRWLHDEIVTLLSIHVKEFDKCRFGDEDFRTTSLNYAMTLKDKIFKEFKEHNIYELADDEPFERRSRYLKEQRKLKAKFEEEICELKKSFEQ